MSTTRKAPTRPVAKRRRTLAQRKAREALAWTWGLLIFGTVVSVAFNIRATAEHTHEALALGSAVAWPVVAVAGMKVMTLVAWPRRIVAQLARFVGVGGASVAAMVMSMTHTRAVLAMWGTDPAATWAGPIVIDLGMIAAGAALVVMHTPQRTTRRKARKATTRKATVPTTAPQLAVA